MWNGFFDLMYTEPAASTLTLEACKSTCEQEMYMGDYSNEDQCCMAAFNTEGMGLTSCYLITDYTGAEDVRVSANNEDPTKDPHAWMFFTA